VSVNVGLEPINMLYGYTCPDRPGMLSGPWLWKIDISESLRAQKRCSVSPEVNLKWETLFRLDQGQPRMGDVVPSRPRPTSDGRRCSVSSEANLGPETFRLAWGQPQIGDVVPSRPRPALGGRSSHDSLEASSRREKQSWLARGYL
jgi:hypothetical protein